jgi:hypothetical protein
MKLVDSHSSLIVHRSFWRPFLGRIEQIAPKMRTNKFVAKNVEQFFLIF